MLFKLMLISALAVAPTSARAQQWAKFEVATSRSHEAGRAYIDAYIARDWDRLEPMLSDDVRFEDSTAKYVFGGTPKNGKPDLMRFFRTAYSGISSMKFDIHREFASSDNALFEGVLDWTVDMGGHRFVSTSMPFVVVLSMQDGKVVSHHDYADYRPFIRSDTESLRRLNKAEAE